MSIGTYYELAGLGQTPLSTAQQAQLNQVVAGASAVTDAQIVAHNYVGAAGSALLGASAYLATNPVTIVAAPFVAIAGAVGELLGSIGIGKGCGQTCITATEFANQAENLLRQNLNTYMALPAPRTQSEQQSALAVFNQIWQALISPQACGNPSLGSAGQNCISQRQDGACAYKVNGQCWNWWTGSSRW